MQTMALIILQIRNIFFFFGVVWEAQTVKHNRKECVGSRVCCIQGPLTREEANLLVADIRDQGSNCFQSVLSVELLEELRNQIQKFPSRWI